MPQLVLFMPSAFKHILLAAFLVFLSSAAFAKEQKKVVLYAYHLMPPYLIDLEKEQGLYFDFARYLNSKSSEYHFEVEYLPRKRIERMLVIGKLKGALLGVNPVWFKDKTEAKYLWTTKVMSDRDQFVSLRFRPLEYNGPASLKGKSFGSVLGFYHFGVDELVAQKLITRVNTNSQEAILSMVLSRRVDTGIVSDAALKYFITQNQWQGKFHISQKPHDKFDRRILVPKDLPHLHLALQGLIEGLDSDPVWTQLQAKYK